MRHNLLVTVPVERDPRKAIFHKVHVRRVEHLARRDLEALPPRLVWATTQMHAPSGLLLHLVAYDRIGILGIAQTTTRSHHLRKLRLAPFVPTRISALVRRPIDWQHCANVATNAEEVPPQVGCCTTVCHHLAHVCTANAPSALALAVLTRRVFAACREPNWRVRFVAHPATCFRCDARVGEWLGVVRVYVLDIVAVCSRPCDHLFELARTLGLA